MMNLDAWARLPFSHLYILLEHQSNFTKDYWIIFSLQNYFPISITYTLQLHNVSFSPMTCWWLTGFNVLLKWIISVTNFNILVSTANYICTVFQCSYNNRVNFEFLISVFASQSQNLKNVFSFLKSTPQIRDAKWILKAIQNFIITLILMAHI